MVNHKVPFLTFTFTAENGWLNDLADRKAKIYNVGIHPETARRKGLRDGQQVNLETFSGRKQSAVLRVTEGVHPQVISVPGILGRWATRNKRSHGKGVHFNSLLKYSFDQIDTVSAALDACVKVKVAPAGVIGPRDPRGRRGERILCHAGEWSSIWVSVWVVTPAPWLARRKTGRPRDLVRPRL